MAASRQHPGVKESLLWRERIRTTPEETRSRRRRKGGRRRGEQRCPGRKLIPPQAAIFAGRIRPSCGSASAGIRPLVRESPSIKIHDGWSASEDLLTPGRERERVRKRKREREERERKEKKKESWRERKKERMSARAMVAQQVAWRKHRANTHIAYFASCTRVHTYVDGVAVATGRRGPFYKTLPGFIIILGERINWAWLSTRLSLRAPHAQVPRANELSFQRSDVRTFMRSVCAWAIVPMNIFVWRRESIL